MIEKQSGETGMPDQADAPRAWGFQDADGNLLTEADEKEEMTSRYGNCEFVPVRIVREEEYEKLIFERNEARRRVEFLELEVTDAAQRIAELEAFVEKVANDKYPDYLTITTHACRLRRDHGTG